MFCYVVCNWVQVEINGEMCNVPSIQRDFPDMQFGEGSHDVVDQHVPLIEADVHQVVYHLNISDKAAAQLRRAGYTLITVDGKVDAADLAVMQKHDDRVAELGADATPTALVATLAGKLRMQGIDKADDGTKAVVIARELHRIDTMTPPDKRESAVAELYQRLSDAKVIREDAPVEISAQAIADLAFNLDVEHQIAEQRKAQQAAIDQREQPLPPSKLNEFPR